MSLKILLNGSRGRMGLAISAIAEANTLMGLTPSLGESLGSQLDRLLAIISG